MKTNRLSQFMKCVKWGKSNLTVTWHRWMIQTKQMMPIQWMHRTKPAPFPPDTVHQMEITLSHSGTSSLEGEWKRATNERIRHDQRQWCHKATPQSAVTERRNKAPQQSDAAKRRNRAPVNTIKQKEQGKVRPPCIIIHALLIWIHAPCISFYDPHFETERPQHEGEVWKKLLHQN